MKKLKLLLVACALLVSAGVQAQKDVTSQYITNAKLTESFNVGWTTTNFNGDHTQGNNTAGYAVESYAGWGSVERPSYSMKQDITLPAGNYRLVNYSFYRYGNAYNTDASKSEAYLVAGENKTLIKTLGSIGGQAAYANSMAEAANRFETKMYRNVVEFTIAADNTTISIGVEGTHSEAKSWFICGMFELFDLNDVATVSSPTDMTYAITNPGFEYLNLTGWTNNGFAYVDNNNNIGGKSGLAYIEYYKWGGLENDKSISQTLTNLENGLYEVTVYGHQQQGTPNDGVKLYANDDYTYIGSTTQDYSVRTTVTDGNLTIKIKTEGSTANWTAFDKFRLKFYGDPLKAYQDLLDAAVAGAQALINGAAGSAISTTAKAAWQDVVNANDNDDNAFTEESQFSAAIENITNANTNYQAMASPYALWKKVKAGAEAMALVPNNNSSATTTLTSAVSTQNTAAEAALTAADLNTAISTLRTAIKTFINATEPTAGNKFEITCLVENPSFDDNTITGWTRNITKTGGNAQTTFTCNEFWNNTFDFYQDLSDLPNGSYQLSVQAFSRPGGNDVAYPAYVGGTNSVTAELYVNSDASTVGNIYAYTGNTTGAKVTTGMPDYKCVVEGGTDYWVPNGMEGASLYFADEDVYKTTVAALVEDGNLRIGFRDGDYTDSQWTIFDNFRLYYYGSDKTVYYNQYLPQLIAEVEADKSNALYANVTGKELSDLNTALGVDYSGFTTEQEYSDAIQAIKDAQTAYREAYPSYDDLVAAKEEPALTKISTNIGTGVFQYNETTNNSLYSDYETAKEAVDDYTVTSSTTASDVQDLVTAYNIAVGRYKYQALNAPDAEKRYWLTIVDDGKNWNGNAITFIAGGRDDQGNYGVKYLASANANLNQALKFTATGGNFYKVSALNADGTEQYLTTANLGYDAGNDDTNTERIRTTNDITKALEIEIQATTTDKQFKLYNTDRGAIIANNDNDDVYTARDASFTIAEASQATVNVTIDADVKYGTRIFPFKPELSGVTFYSCDAAVGDVLTLTTVDEPAADTPYILYAENGLSSTNLSGWGVAGALTKVGGALTGVYDENDFKAPAGSFVLQNLNNKVAFYEVKEGEEPTVGANRCYLTWPSGSPARAFFFPENNATAIKAINALTSGKAEIFNASGVQIPALQKGMNIIRTADGKSQKVLVK